MARLDQLHLMHPFLGSRKLAKLLSTPEVEVNRKRVQRLMRLMGLECLFSRPKPRSERVEAVRYPYLLRDRKIDGPLQVWSADITYVAMPMGFMYLVATIDWYSRYVVGWRLSNSLEGSFCQAMLEDVLRQGTPLIFNTDQGSQFTSHAWTSRLESAGVQVSRDGRGRCHDNIFIERLWRSVKQENVYRNGYASVAELEAGLHEYVRFYNEKRPHQSLGYRTPAEVHQQG
jgi:putative transposase